MQVHIFVLVHSFTVPEKTSTSTLNQHISFPPTLLSCCLCNSEVLSDTEKTTVAGRVVPERSNDKQIWNQLERVLMFALQKKAKLCTGGSLSASLLVLVIKIH